MSVLVQVGNIRSAMRGFNLSQMMETRRQRRQLAQLSDHMLDDLGLSREVVAREANRPFWDI